MGDSELGYTLQRPTKHMFPMTESELIAKLTVVLGGRVAEELAFDESSVGAQNDLVRATEIARSMVKEYSEVASWEIDSEIRRVVEAAHKCVKEIFTEERDLLEKVAHIILEKKVIDRETLKKPVSEAA